jgi:hypothetical protein
MIQNELELRHSIKAIAKQYSLAERIAAQTVGSANTRADEIDSVESMIHKIEREIAVYLATKYDVIGVARSKHEQEVEMEQEYVPLKKAA